MGVDLESQFDEDNETDIGNVGRRRYTTSKLCNILCAYELSRRLQKQQLNITVNAFNPGWVKTDMGGSGAPRSPEQGADTAIWLATVAPLNLNGKLFHDRQETCY